MSVRHSILALLAEGDGYGYQLRARFEQLTGAVWPLNIGQVYTTLARLERDGQIENRGTDAEGRTTYRLAGAGRRELALWWLTPVTKSDRPRDELAVKIALALVTPGADTTSILQSQRVATLRTMQDLTRLKRLAMERETAGRGDSGDLSWRLVLESMIFASEAELRWLDHCETSLLKSARGRGTDVRRADGNPADVEREPAEATPDTAR